MAALIGPSNNKPIYVDCNAVSPPTKVEIGNVITKAGSPFVDVGIIGLPPKAGYDGPWHACVRVRMPARFAPLGDFGLNVHVMDGPIGAASALKMSYAGITKGVTALGAMMMLAATRDGVADGLRGGAGAQPAGAAAVASARRSRRCIRQGLSLRRRDGGDRGLRRRGSRGARRCIEAFAEFYTRLAADFEGKHEETDALAAFLKPKQ